MFVTFGLQFLLLKGFILEKHILKSVMESSLHWYRNQRFVMVFLLKTFVFFSKNNHAKRREIDLLNIVPCSFIRK